jgi:hypothetical protein
LTIKRTLLAWSQHREKGAWVLYTCGSPNSK